MILVLLLGGIGRRFRDAGYTCPKHQLPMPDGTPLLRHVLTSYFPFPAKVLVPLLMSYQTSDVMGLFPSWTEFYPLMQESPSPLHTILTTTSLSHALRVSRDAILIADCDSFLDAAECARGVRRMSYYATAGSFIQASTNGGAAYVQVDAAGYAQEIWEKDLFTTTSITGPYWWANAKSCWEDLTHGLMTGLTSIAPCLNHRIAMQPRSVWCTPTKTFQHLGTPQAYETYLAQHGRLVRRGASL